MALVIGTHSASSNKASMNTCRYEAEKYLENFRRLVTALMAALLPPISKREGKGGHPLLTGARTSTLRKTARVQIARNCGRRQPQCVCDSGLTFAFSMALDHLGIAAQTPLPSPIALLVLLVGGRAGG